MKKFIGSVFLLFLVILSMQCLDMKNFRSLLGDMYLPLRYGIYRERNIMVEMRDGIKLASTIYRPMSEGSYPAILIRTTYGGIDFNQIKCFLENHYVVIVQDVRGRYRSQGASYDPHRYSRPDGYDTIDWIVKQKWSSGKVGTFGCSYLGESQILLAATNHPNHIAMIAGGAGGAIGKARNSYGYFGLYENGVLNLASALGWFTAEGATNFKITPQPPDYAAKIRTEMIGLPVVQLARKTVPYATGYDDFVSHSLTDRWWEQEGYIDGHDSFSAATLHVNTWYDQTVHDTFRLAEFMAENAKHPRAREQCVLIDPGVHCQAGELQNGLMQIGEMKIQYKKLDFMKIYLDWFDYWLKGKKVDLPPRFRFFLIHANSWKSSDQWPPANVQLQNFYLNSERNLSLSKPELHIDSGTGEASDSFIYDPLNPVPTIGGPVCCTYMPDDIAGALDQSTLKSRDDVLIFTSGALKSDLDLTGNAKAILFVSTTALDTDFTLKLVDQYPNGPAYNLQDGVVRLRYRAGIDKPKLAVPGEIYRIELELRPIAYRFKKGHRIAAYISSSNFPRLARNLNTGEEEYKSQKTKVAENRVYRSNMHMSYLELPVATQ